jgi:hypothetical protein
MTDDAEKIRRAIPESDYMRTEYLNFLIGQGHLDVAAPVARAVAVRATARDLGPLLAYCGNAMTKDAGSAVVVWNLLSRRGLEPFGALDPGSGSILTNGEFLTAPVAAGFDWHFSAADGVSVTMAGGDGVAVELTGEQAQAVNVMNEWIPLDKDGTYRIQFRYSSGEDGPMARSQASGLTWEVENPLGGAVLARSSDLKTGVSGVTDHFDFSAAGASVAVLSLRYERVPGTVRRQEKFTIQRVASQRLGAPLRP